MHYHPRQGVQRRRRGPRPELRVSALQGIKEGEFDPEGFPPILRFQRPDIFLRVGCCERGNHVTWLRLELFVSDPALVDTGLWNTERENYALVSHCRDHTGLFDNGTIASMGRVQGKQKPLVSALVTRR